MGASCINLNDPIGLFLYEVNAFFNHEPVQRRASINTNYIDLAKPAFFKLKDNEDIDWLFSDHSV